MRKSILYSIVIPVYNSNRSIEELVNRLNTAFQNVICDTHEIILVDDCSPRSETWDILKTIAKNNQTVRVFHLSKNFGQAGALLCGMAQARGEWIITMDDDLQHRPEDIHLLVQYRDHDVVIARFPEKRCGYFKKLTSHLKGKLDAHLLGKPEDITASPFRLIKRRVAQDMIAIHTPRPFIIAMILSVTSDIINADVTHEARKYGKSNYSLRKSFSLISNLLFNNSSFILRAMSAFGFTLAGLSFIFGIFLVFRGIIKEQVVMGWTSLMVVLLISTGAIICSLGILGEYLARLIATAELRPSWIICDRIDNVENGQ